MDGRMEERGTAARRGVHLFFCCGRYLGEVSRYMYVERERERYLSIHFLASPFSVSNIPWNRSLIFKKRKRKKITEKKNVHLFHPHHHHYTTTRTTKTRNHRPRRQNHSDARNPSHDNNTRLSDNDIDMDIVIRGRIDIITSSHSACTCIWTWDISYHNGNFYSRSI